MTGAPSNAGGTGNVLEMTEGSLQKRGSGECGHFEWQKEGG